MFQGKTMSSVDLNKLIAKKTYFLALEPSDIINMLGKELGLTWEANIVRKHSAIFLWNFRMKWALSMAEKPVTEEKIKKFEEEFDKNYLKNSLILMDFYMENVPYEVHFVIKKKRESGYICHVRCYPLLYGKIVRKKDKIECDDAKIQDARVRCEDFLDELFIGGLGAEEVHEKEESNRWELLINDVNNRQITNRIYEMLEQATGEVLTIGWIGTDCIPKFIELKSKGIAIQSIAHKPSEIKSPVPRDIQQGFKNLINLIGKTNISSNPEVHGRVLIVDNKALIGSMDLNAHSLSGEHIEFAVYTEDIDTVRRIRAYFKKIFSPLK